jgi:hypothetical protein
MSNHPDEPPSEDAELDDVQLDDVQSDDALLDEDEADEETIDEFAERRGLDEESWIADGDKYRCPESEAVHQERADACRVCGWQQG